MEGKIFPNGLTVRELKAIIAEWPEVDAFGEPTEVWIETEDGNSNQVLEVFPLNMRENSADIILSKGE